VSAAEQHLEASGSRFPTFCSGPSTRMVSPAAESHLCVLRVPWNGRVGVCSPGFKKHQPLGGCRCSGIARAVQGMVLRQQGQTLAGRRAVWVGAISHRNIQGTAGTVPHK